MIGAFNTVYKALQGLLSADFWATIFAPLAVFAALHALILTRFGWHPDFAQLFADAGKDANQLIIAAIGLVLLGYIAQAFLPLLRGLLDGSLLPTWLHDWLRRGRVAEARQMTVTIADARRKVTAFTLAQVRAMDRAGPLQTAYQKALSLPGAPDEVSVDAASRAVTRLETVLSQARLPDPQDLVAATTLLIDALSRNNPALDPAAPNADRSQRLDRVQERLTDLLKNYVNEAIYEYEIIQTRNRVPAALTVPRATLLGDARYVVERYAVDVYNVNFDFLWPRLMMALRATAKDDPDIAAVDTARARIDFAILSLMLTCSIPAVWLPVIILQRSEGWLALAIGGLTPVVLKIFYHMTVEAQLALADVIRSTIDRHRTLVLDMFSQPLPPTRAEERRLWQRIRMAEEDGRVSDLAYAPPPEKVPVKL